MVHFSTRLNWLTLFFLLFFGPALLARLAPGLTILARPLLAAPAGPRTGPRGGRANPKVNCQFTSYGQGSTLFAPGYNGVQLDITVRVPIHSAGCLQPAAGWPMIVSVPQYAGNKDSVALRGIDNAQSGYVSVGFSWRGMGNSTGDFRFLHTDEWADLRSLTNWLLNTYPVTAPIVDKNRIGIEGDSMGGAAAWMAATQNMGYRDAIPTNASPYLANDFVPNGCVDNGLALFFNSSQPVRWDPATQNELWADYVNLNDVGPLRSFFAGPSRNFGAFVPQTSAYVFGNASWTDLFQFAPGLLSGYDADPLAPKRIYLTSNGHENYFDFADVGALEENNRSAWHDHWLKDVPNGIETGGPISYLGYLPGDPTNPANHILSTDTATWPPAGTVSTTLYLRKGGALSLTAPGPAEGASTIINTLLDPTYSMTQAVISEVPPFSLTFTRIPTSSVVFTSPVLAQSVWWYGEPQLTSFTSADRATYNLATLFYDVTLDSQGREVSSYLITRAQSCWQVGDGGARTYDGLDMARRILAGHVIRVVYQNLDPETSGPGFIAQRIRPYFGNFAAQLAHSASQPSNLVLPLRPDNPGSPIWDTPIAPHYFPALFFRAPVR